MEVLIYAIPFLIKTSFLSLALWVMVKIQKFQYNLPGLLGSAALASALDMVPYFGHFIAVPALYVCLMKVTREDLSGVIFTGGISYALVFVMNLFLIGALMGSLRMSARQPADTEANDQRTGQEDQAEPETKPDEASQTANSASPASAHASPSGERPASKARPELARDFSLKGVMKNSKSSMAMISSRGKTYTIALGESLPMETAGGKVTVTLDKVEEDFVTLRVAGERVDLRR